LRAAWVSDEHDTEQNVMSEIRELVLNAAGAILEEQCTQRVLQDAGKGLFATALWSALQDAGIPWALVPESQGGAGLSIQDAGALIRQAAYYAAPVPLCETVLASWLLNAAGMPVPEGALSVGFAGANTALDVGMQGAQRPIKGSVAAVPWSGDVAAVILVVEKGSGLVLVQLPSGSFAEKPGINLAGEPRNTIEIDTRVAAESVCSLPQLPYSTAYELGAALRAAQISGALQRTLEMSVSYTMERKQFGRPLAKFQAVQNNLAILACQAAAANGVAELALNVATKPGSTMAIAAAKARAGEAATVGAAIAHQVHGAMGLTSEYILHQYTQRLWSWRDEFGGESYWWARLGEAMLEGGADQYWQKICEVDDLVAGQL
jgi:acyl-CoA dehydrogenase